MLRRALRKVRRADARTKCRARDPAVAVCSEPPAEPSKTRACQDARFQHQPGPPATECVPVGWPVAGAADTPAPHTGWARTWGHPRSPAPGGAGVGSGSFALRRTLRRVSGRCCEERQRITGPVRSPWALPRAQGCRLLCYALRNQGAARPGDSPRIPWPRARPSQAVRPKRCRRWAGARSRNPLQSSTRAACRGRSRTGAERCMGRLPAREGGAFGKV